MRNLISDKFLTKTYVLVYSSIYQTWYIELDSERSWHSKHISETSISSFAEILRFMRECVLNVVSNNLLYGNYIALAIVPSWAE